MSSFFSFLKSSDAIKKEYDVDTKGRDTFAHSTRSRPTACLAFCGASAALVLQPAM